MLYIVQDRNICTRHTQYWRIALHPVGKISDTSPTFNKFHRNTDSALQIEPAVTNALYSALLIEPAVTNALYSALQIEPAVTNALYSALQIEPAVTNALSSAPCNC